MEQLVTGLLHTSVVVHSGSAQLGQHLCPFPIFFADLMSIVKRLPHAYADDVQIYVSCTSSEIGTLQECISVCCEEVSAWTTSNRLQLNPSKTEFLWCASYRRQSQIPAFPLCIGNTCITPVSAVRKLGVHLDSNVTLSTHVTATVRPCFGRLRQIRSVRRSLTP